MSTGSNYFRYLFKNKVTFSFVNCGYRQLNFSPALSSFLLMLGPKWGKKPGLTSRIRNNGLNCWQYCCIMDMCVGFI